MPESSQLHRWLQQEESAGTLESQGHFTLEQSKAWEKLGAFQLPFAEAWALKFVQAGMACPEGTLAITQSREETTFRFRGVSHWTRESIESAVFSTTQRQDELGHLAIALRALALQKTRPFSLKDSEGAVWAWTGESFTVLEPEVADSQVVVTVANYEFGKSKSLFSLSYFGAINFRASVSKALAEHCHLCSERLTLDGRALNGYEADPSFGLTDHSQPLYLFKTAHLESCPPLSIAGRVENGTVKLGAHSVAVPRGVLVQQSHQTQAGAYGILSLFFKEQVKRENMKLDRTVYTPGFRGSEIIWLNDGVVVKREPIGYRGALGLGILISANGLPTDLTALAPLENEQKQARVQQSLVKLEELLRTFQEKLGPEGLRVTGGKGMTALTGIAGTVLLFTIPVIGLAVLGKAGFAYRESKATQDKLATAFDGSLDELVSYLRHQSKALA